METTLYHLMLASGVVVFGAGNVLLLKLVDLPIGTWQGFVVAQWKEF